MHATSLTDLAETQLAIAREASSGRSAATVFGGQEHDLRQTLIALAEGRALGEHEAPGEATLLVLRGRVRVESPDGDVEASTGNLWVLTHERHSVHAVEDSVFLLTTLTGLGRASHS